MRSIKPVLTSRYLEAVRPANADEGRVLRDKLAEPEGCLHAETTRSPPEVAFECEGDLGLFVNMQHSSATTNYFTVELNSEKSGNAEQEKLHTP